MTTTNIIPINGSHPRNDADVFIRACNSPAQQARREERRKAHKRKVQRSTATVYTGLITAGAILGYILGTVI